MNILEVISCLGSKPKHEFEDIIRHFYPNESGFRRYCIQRNLEALGHIYTDHEKGKVSVLAPRMCVLPTREHGFSRVALIGARPNEKLFIDELKTFCVKYGDSLNVVIKPEDVENGFPCNITLVGESTKFFEKIQEISNGHSLLYAESQRLSARGLLSRNSLLLGDSVGTPGAWIALHSNIESSSAESLSDRINFVFQSVSQELGNADSWKVFDPSTKNWEIWSKIRNAYDRHLLLIQKEIYKYLLATRTDSGWRLYLEKFSHDPLWSKWAVLQAKDEAQSLLPQIGGWDFKILQRLPLPIELHRVCCLCSGFLPVPEADGEMLRYSNIPLSIQCHLVRKLSFKLNQNN